MNSGKKKFNMYFPSSKSYFSIMIRKKLCDWGFKLFQYDIDKHVRGSPSPLWVNVSVGFYRCFFISNCTSCLIFILFFVILLIQSSKNSSGLVEINKHSILENVDFDSENKTSPKILFNYFNQLNVSETVKKENISGTYIYTCEKQDWYPENFNLELSCACILKKNTTKYYETRYDNTTYRNLMENYDIDYDPFIFFLNEDQQTNIFNNISKYNLDYDYQNSFNNRILVDQTTTSTTTIDSTTSVNSGNTATASSSTNVNSGGTATTSASTNVNSGSTATTSTSTTVNTDTTTKTSTVETTIVKKAAQSYIYYLDKDLAVCAYIEKCKFLFKILNLIALII